jgi:hypothetical protein
MSGRLRSPRAQAEHCRQLAEWTDDLRTQHILIEMARELEEVEDEPDAAGAPAPEPPPRSLS